ncbi:MAG: hypothetical protein Q4D64_02650, partial [Prevotellaceae bacterium]|nr:hypothetical protein [Prevotellaceae bacterium]MDO5128801.1 hypothetical protein [Prevotellaceae bacterium]
MNLKLGCLSGWNGQSALCRPTSIPNSLATSSIGVALISFNFSFLIPNSSYTHHCHCPFGYTCEIPTREACSWRH